MQGKRAIIVMPQISARVKIDAVQSYGAKADLIDTASITREGRVAELADENPDAYIASAYDDDYVIAGNATLGKELAEVSPVFDAIIAPIGGGGLTSGLITGLAAAGSAIPIIGAEPLLANDAAQSLRAGRIITSDGESTSIADGARTRSVGRKNWAILQKGLKGIVEVPEDMISRAVFELFLNANLKAEPTGALSLAAIFTDPEQFRDKRICCVVSGGNVDPAVYAQLIQL
jgi:threonine dehydratase